jgi:hypothetical protein
VFTARWPATAFSAVVIALSAQSGCAQEIPVSAFDRGSRASGHIIRLNHNSLVGEVGSAREVTDGGRIRTILLTPTPFGEQEAVMATLVELDCSNRTVRPVSQAPMSNMGVPTGAVLESDGRHVRQQNDEQLFALVCDQQPAPSSRTFASVEEYRRLVDEEVRS